MMRSHFLSKLNSVLGPRQAKLELRWMRQSAANEPELSQMVERRTRGEPLQYILGTQPFGPLDIIVRPPVLIPRPETEQWTYTLVDKIIGRLAPFNHPKNLTVLDLCTGTGCIPLLLCTLLTLKSGIQTEAIGVDISSTACRLAQDNVMSAKLRFPSLSSIRILQKDLFESDFWSTIHNTLASPPNDIKSLRQLDLITANPPYISVNHWRRLPSEVKNWEDPVALLGDPASIEDNLDRTANWANEGGLRFYRRIHDLISTCTILSTSCILALEIGEDQGSALVNLFHHQFQHIEVWKDSWGKDRALFCTMKR